MEKQEVIKIGLNGFEFQKANKGCEALTYSFLKIIEEYVRERKVDLVILNTNLDFNELKNDFKYINNIYTLPFPGKNPFIWKNMITEIKSCLAVFDVTYGDSFSDIYGNGWLIKTNIIKQAVLWSKTPLVLLPQTYGPFHNKILEKWSMNIIKRAKYVYSRDDESTEYIKSNIGREFKIVSTTDMAFELPYNKSIVCKKDEEINIGINISGLLWCDKYNKFGLKFNYREFYIKLIDTLSKDCHNNIYIIPHVIDNTEYNLLDNDLIPCEELKKVFGDKIIIAPLFKSAIDAKSFISGMDIFVGARMHSTIAAISSGVPTLPFSYSRKFEGLFGSLSYPYVVNAREETAESAYELVLKYFDKKESLSKVQFESMKIVNEKNIAFKESLAHIFRY